MDYPDINPPTHIYRYRYHYTLHAITTRYHYTLPPLPQRLTRKPRPPVPIPIPRAPFFMILSIYLSPYNPFPIRRLYVYSFIPCGLAKRPVLHPIRHTTPHHTTDETLFRHKTLTSVLSLSLSLSLWLNLCRCRLCCTWLSWLSLSSGDRELIRIRRVLS